MRERRSCAFCTLARSLADPAPDPRQQEVGGKREREREREVVAVAEPLDRATRDRAGERATQVEERREERVLRRRLLLVADVHQEREEGRGPQAGAEALAERRGVDSRASGVRPRRDRVTEVRDGLEEPEDPESAEDAPARRERAPDERARDRRGDPERRRDRRDLGEAEPAVDPERL